MDFKELILTRYSVRKFKDQAVEADKLQTILEAVKYAPSAVNFQPYKVYVFKDSEMLEQIKECYHREWINKAPVVLVFTGVHEMAWKRAQDAKDHTDIDVAIAVDHLSLQAADLGLGTCWVCNFDVAKVRDVLKLEMGEEPIAIIPLGYPLYDDVPVKKRKSLNEIVIEI